MGNSRKLRRSVGLLGPQGIPLKDATLDTKIQAHNSPIKGKYNGYKCEKCGVITLTVDRDEGVTPMFLACRAETGCDGQSISLGYPGGPVPANLLPVRWEWFRPDPKSVAEMEPEMRDYIQRGGLELRKINV